METEQEQMGELPQFNYDNEWVKFLSELSQNGSQKDICDFIKMNQWNERQMHKIMSYARIVLGRGVGTTFLASKNDLMCLRDDKSLIDCDVPLGLLRVDITPEFNMLMSMMSYHFRIESSRSINGFFIKRVGLQKTEVEIENKKQQGLTGLKNKIFGE